jgi:hypothetical protein
MAGARSIVRGTTGVGWSIPPDRQRWMIWLRGGVHALLSLEPASHGTTVRVDLVSPDLGPFVEVLLAGSTEELASMLLEEIATAAVDGDLALLPDHRRAWSIAIRSTAEQIRRRKT